MLGRYSSLEESLKPRGRVAALLWTLLGIVVVGALATLVTVVLSAIVLKNVNGTCVSSSSVCQTASGSGESPCSCTYTTARFDDLVALYNSGSSATASAIATLGTTITNGFASLLTAFLASQSTQTTNINNAVTLSTATIVTNTTTQLNDLLQQIRDLAGNVKVIGYNTAPTVGSCSTPKFYCKFAENVLTDPMRSRNGAYTLNATYVGGPRKITQMVWRPSLLPGTGSPYAVSDVRSLFDGSDPNYPLLTSNLKVQLERTYTNNVPVAEPLPWVIAGGGGANGMLIVRLAEQICSHGFVVSVFGGIGTDSGICPSSIAGCGTAAAGQFLLNDLVSAVNVTDNGQNSLIPLGILKTDINGTIIGCIGGSASASSCLQLAAGLGGGAAVNGFPAVLRLNEPNKRVRAVAIGDSFLTPGNAFFNFTEFRASLAIFNHGLLLNWPRAFPDYGNAAWRVYYQPKYLSHPASDFSTQIICLKLRECGRVSSDGSATLFDNATCGLFMGILGPAYQFGHCQQADVGNYSAIISTLYDAPRKAALAALLPNVPLTGIPMSDIESMINYYMPHFFKAVLNNDADAAKIVTTNAHPSLLEGIYVNKVPGTNGHPFNLQNKTIQYDLSADRTHHVVSISNRVTGPIPDPSTTSGAFSLFGNSAFSRSTAGPAGLALAMGAFPLPTNGNANRASTNYIWLAGSGIARFEMGGIIIDNMYREPRVSSWLAQSGSAQFAMFGYNIANLGAVNASYTGNKIWVVNNANMLRVTHYQVGIQGGAIPNRFNVQTTFLPNGTIIHELDDTIPSNILSAEPRNPSAVVGFSSGRLYLNATTNRLEPLAHPKIRTFTDILAGLSSVDSDAVFEAYTSDESAKWGSGITPFVSLSEEDNNGFFDDVLN